MKKGKNKKLFEFWQVRNKTIFQFEKNFFPCTVIWNTDWKKKWENRNTKILRAIYVKINFILFFIQLGNIIEQKENISHVLCEKKTSRVMEKLWKSRLKLRKLVYYWISTRKRVYTFQVYFWNTFEYFLVENKKTRRKKILKSINLFFFVLFFFIGNQQENGKKECT